MVLAQPLPGAGPDSERLQRARLGDSSALQELITSHRSLVEHEARRFVSDHDDIEDIAQETWIRAAQALGSLRDESRFRPWLRTITRNACLTFLSRHQQSDSLDDDDAPDPADRATDGPEASAEQRDERRRVWEALGALTELDRRALYLREVESLPFDEVARRLGVRKNAAEVRVHRARARFRQLYEATDATSPACGMAGIRLALHLEGELHGETAVAVETHLSSCTACTLRMRKMADGRSLYRRMGMFSLPGLTGLLERFQRFADSAIRWFPVDAAPVIASSGSAPATAVSGMTTAVVAAVVLTMPSMLDVGQTVVAHVPLPSPVTTMLSGGPPDAAPVLTTASHSASGSLIPSPAAAKPATVPVAGSGPRPVTPPTIDASPDIDFGPPGGPEAPVPAPGGAPAAVAVPPIQVLAAASVANSAPLMIAASATSGAPVVSTEGGSATKDTASKPRGDGGGKDNDKDSRVRDERSRDERDDRGRDSRSKDDDRGALKANAWARGDDSSGGKGASNQKSDDAPKNISSSPKVDDGGNRGSASAPRGENDSKPSAPAPRGDDGGNRGNAPAPRGDDGGGRGGDNGPKGNDGGERGHDGGHGNEGGGKGGGNGKH
ncbi:MAG: sigma-70 family RNA polymerase sigma factor [Dehalococcoidia bacterium]|nr:MAG: sigma-70 family RNA polymerase sigma factor [Dehalococcoidia bacterium]